MFIDPDRRPSGETPLPLPAKTMGQVLQFPGASVPPAETPARKARKAPANKTGAPDFLTKHLFVMAALADPNLSDRGKVMLAVIVEEYRADWGCAKRSHAYLARRAGTSERTGRRAVDDCVKGGFLRKHVDRKGKDSEVNTYWPIWEKAAAMRPDVATAPAETCGQMWPHGIAKDGHTVWPDVAYESHLDPTERTTEGEAQAPARSRGPAFARETGSAVEPVKPALPVKASLPVDWTPDDDTRRHCAALLSATDLASSLRRFRSHFAVENPERRFRDWGEQFRTWVERDAAKAARTASATPKRRDPNGPMM